MSRRYIKAEYFYIALFFFIPTHAHANAGIPMLFLVMPIFALALLPIILIETLYFSKRLSLSLLPSLKTVTLSNLISTLVGIPMTWGILLICELVIWEMTGEHFRFDNTSTLGKMLTVITQAPYLFPFQGLADWMISAATVALLIPFFLASWWVEFYVSRKLLPDVEPRLLNIATRNANLITYVLMTILEIGLFIFQLPHPSYLI